MVEELAQEENQAELEKEKIMEFYSTSTWYTNIVYFLLYLQCPKHLDRKYARSLKLRITKYCLVEQQLFWKDPGDILLRCLDKPEIEGVISESHEGSCGGHKYWKETLQDFKSWVLLALFVCRCISTCKSLHPLSEVCW